MADPAKVVEAAPVVPKAEPTAKVETKPATKVEAPEAKLEATAVAHGGAVSASVALSNTQSDKAKGYFPTASPKESKAHARSVQKHQAQMGYPNAQLEKSLDGVYKEAPGTPKGTPPAVSAATRDEGGSYSMRVFFQFIFALGYWLLVVKKFPVLPPGTQPNEQAIKLQRTNEVVATFETSLPNCFLSWCCTGPRAAHTFHSTRIMNYWAGCLLMTCFPMCTLWLVNSFTDLNERLGGEKRNCIMGLLCACCCSCCVVAQDAESLDLIMGMDTHLCSATIKR